MTASTSLRTVRCRLLEYDAGHQVGFSSRRSRLRTRPLATFTSEAGRTVRSPTSGVWSPSTARLNRLPFGLASRKNARAGSRVYRADLRCPGTALEATE